MCLYHWSDISEMSAYCHHNTTLSTPAAPHPPADYLHLSALIWLLVRIMFTTGSSLIRAVVEVICLVSLSDALWKSPLWSLFKGDKVKKRAEVTSWEQWSPIMRNPCQNITYSWKSEIQNFLMLNVVYVRQKYRRRPADWRLRWWWSFLTVRPVCVTEPVRQAGLSKSVQGCCTNSVFG